MNHLAKYHVPVSSVWVRLPNAETEGMLTSFSAARGWDLCPFFGQFFERQFCCCFEPYVGSTRRTLRLFFSGFLSGRMNKNGVPDVMFGRSYSDALRGASSRKQNGHTSVKETKSMIAEEQSPQVARILNAVTGQESGSRAATKFKGLRGIFTFVCEKKRAFYRQK